MTGAGVGSQISGSTGVTGSNISGSTGVTGSNIAGSARVCFSVFVAFFSVFLVPPFLFSGKLLAGTSSNEMTGSTGIGSTIVGLSSGASSLSYLSSLHFFTIMHKRRKITATAIVAYTSCFEL